MIDRSETLRKLAMHAARWSGLAPLARPLIGGVGVILMLHRTTATPERPQGFNRHLNVHPAFLDRTLDRMKRDGYAFVTLDEAIDRLRGGEPGAQPFAAVTADDGYRDNLTEALPVFERHAVPFTVYVAPGLIDGTAHLWWELADELVHARDRVAVPTGDGWEDLPVRTPAERAAAFARLHRHLTEETPEEEQAQALLALCSHAGLDPERPRRLLMNWGELATLSRHPLATIGAHTVSHANLRRLSVERARLELQRGADILEQRLGRRPRHLAYPYGYPSAVGPREVELAAEAGYVSAVTTRHGLLQPGHRAHVTALPRISLNGRYQNLGHLRTMLSGVTTPLANNGKVLVTV